MLQVRGVPERADMHATHGSRLRGIVQFQRKCLLTGVRNSVRDRLDVPQKILARRPGGFRVSPRVSKPRLVRPQLNETAINRLANVIYDARDISLTRTLSKEKTSKTFSLFKERLLFTM